MKLTNTNNPVQVNGGSETSSFRIALNGKAFKVLSSTLYQNKIGSIVRELSCNAYDSHISAGCKDRPFVIHLPDAFEPWFSVRDFGVGLNKEDVRTIFTVYFESTKDQSNDSIGAFGLGAKTPFAYTDQFTVRSVKDGQLAMYSCYLMEDGIPNITEMFSESTDEENGVEIKLSVKKEDYNKFAEEVSNQLTYFKVKPEIENASSSFKGFTNVSNVTVIVEKEDFKLTTNAAFYGQANFTIVQGQVGYPVNLATLDGKISDENYSFLHTVSSAFLLIEFAIGEIGVTASREGIEYDKITCENIDRKLDLIRSELTKTIDDKVAHLNTDWEKCVFMNKNSFLNKYTTISLTGSKIVKRYGSYWYDFDELEKNYYDVYILRDVKMKQRIRRVEVSDDFVILVCDKTRFSNKKRQHFLDQNQGKRIFELREKSEVPDQALVDQMKINMGGFDKFVMLSSIELPVVAKAPKVYVKRDPIGYCVKPLSDTPSTTRWLKVSGDLSDIKVPTIYLTVERINASVNEAIEYSSALQMPEFASYKIIAIREKDVDKVRKLKNFIHISDFFEKTKQQYLKDKQLIRKLTRQLNLEFFTQSYSTSKISLLQSEVTSESKLKDILSLVSLYEKEVKKISNTDRMKRNFVESHIRQKYNIGKLHNFVEKYLDKQPLLKGYMAKYSFDVDAKTVVQYALALEKARKFNLV